MPVSRASRFPRRGSYAEALRIGDLLRRETVGGALLVAFAAAAIVWANSPFAASYFALRDVTFGPAGLHLDLTLGGWAADGLLAVFFFMVGLELKSEFVAGDLRRPAAALVPVTAAATGVAVPALLYLAVAGADPAYRHGWAIPTATDIAFAVAVLAIIGSHLPRQLRLFLLTLAVVDDLIAIVIIAVFYTDHLSPLPLAGALAAVAVFAVVVQRGRRWFLRATWAAWVVLLPIGIVAWAALHASGIHATLAGVALGFTVPVRHPDGGDSRGLAGEFEHRFRPLSTAVAVPLFAFFSAGVALGGWGGFVSALSSPVTLGIVAGLVVGKPIGIVAGVWVTTRLSRIRLDPSLRWVDLLGVGMLGGIGFTVSLLVADLSFDASSPEHGYAKVAILLASVVSAGLASVLLTVRNRRYRVIEQEESVDADADGIPDVYQADASEGEAEGPGGDTGTGGA
ncbi:Na+/H+ antiporter NhaA [Propionicicella superfundia]|uniref:Na+/H+ antiporter NhaA n=1 Tax=Propionicicella superfundia TaxID=348582 RepID=UPI000417B9D3|nr:Na+/H+ antiporter NhaA [Propionicicella superfundia]